MFLFVNNTNLVDILNHFQDISSFKFYKIQLKKFTYDPVDSMERDQMVPIHENWLMLSPYNVPCKLKLVFW